MELKVAVIGAGSTYTPELIEGLAARAELLGLTELWLHDIDAERLDIVGGPPAGSWMRASAGRLELTGDREAATRAPVFVLVQLRVGGLAARLLDETIPPRFAASAGRRRSGRVQGAPDGAGARHRRRHRPARRRGAWLLDFTNPAGLVPRRRRRRTGAIGLCNIPDRLPAHLRRPARKSSWSGSR